MSEPIVFYDLPGNAAKDKAWSPNTWKTRFCLNIKGIPYKTVWVEYPDIAALSKKVGLSPTDTDPSGLPHYTLPAIYDPNTRTAVAESIAIARYLDRTYPSSGPTLIPKETDALHMAFIQAFRDAFMDDAGQLVLPATCAQLNPRSEAYFRRTREEWFKAKLEDFAPAGSEKREQHWKGLEKGLHTVKGWLEADGTEKLHFMGDKVSFADVYAVSYLLWMKLILGPESEEWMNMMRWDGGYWERFMAEFDKWETVDVGTAAEM
ncbi:hypothetical protein L226DRAFT_610957 [Lentinus tigrinus ALCF2SS1-7]|uniref:GST N-terminal domain-containing protein n=1 Tax=Lentinus tigrinus ALCF2SS1-6 TaxID=1328759 RepID=A0A5C2SH08_9APHY|nr:hypothetical protein L227DRAFT_592522 [Lentinus tigrinus ALCF2SS1-6]RPD77730.1 hypothetical protein L226DRAFT_610957 [Lentinus tigrinus ALCF2SS1-7]